MLDTKRSRIFLGIVFSLFIVGCNVQESLHPFSSEIQLSESAPDKIEVQKASAGILYKISYIQSTATFSTRKPAALKTDKNSDFVLNGFDKIKETITIDNAGNVSVINEWLDGSADINMPIELYNRVANIQPAYQEDPVVRSEMAHGSIKFYSKSGKVAHEYAVDASTMKVDTHDFIKALRNNRVNETASRIANNLDNLQRNGISFEQVNDRYAELSSPVEFNGEIIQQRQLLDLHLGRVIASFDMGADGKMLGREFLKYSNSDVFPVMRNSMSESYGESDGKWMIKHRTTIVRDNIEISVSESLIGE